MSAGIAAEPVADALDDLRIEAACLGLLLRAVLTSLACRNSDSGLACRRKSAARLSGPMNTLSKPTRWMPCALRLRARAKAHRQFHLRHRAAGGLRAPPADAHEMWGHGDGFLAAA